MSIAPITDSLPHRADEYCLCGTCAMRLEDYAREVVAGGFPALRPLAAAVQKVALNSYLERIVDRDVLERIWRILDPVEAWLPFLVMGPCLASCLSHS
jgi:hypothetical protein